jgi:hypothetical protein
VSSLFVVLDPASPPVPGLAAPAPGEVGPAPFAVVTPGVPVDLSLVPGQAQTAWMPVTREAAEEFVSVAYIAGGRESVQILVDSVAPPPLRPRPAVGTPADRAHRLLAEVARENEDDAAEALAEVELIARQVFLEMLESARAATQFSRYGLVEASRGLLRAVPDIQPLRDAGVTYRALRTAFADLHTAALAVREAEEHLQAAQVSAGFLDLLDVMHLVTGGRSPAAPPVSRSVSAEVKALIDASAAYTDVLRRHAERFPALPMVAGDLVEATADWAHADVVAMANDTTRYNTRLDDKLLAEIGKACRETWEAGPDLARELLDEADEVLARARRLISLGPMPAEGTYAFHPLWRYPLIVHAALERLGYGPGSLPHAAAADVLRRAEDIARRRAEEKAATDQALNWANFGFGVLSFVPVVGQLACAAAFACAAVQAVRDVSAYAEASREARAFGPYASSLGLTEPEGAGWIALAFAGLVFDVVPVFRACGQLTGRLVRLTPLPRPVTPGLADVVAASINLLFLIAAERAQAAGVRDTP